MLDQMCVVIRYSSTRPVCVGASAMAFGRWRAEAMTTMSFLALHTAWRWRQSTRTRLRGWRQWQAAACGAADRREWRLISEAPSRRLRMRPVLRVWRVHAQAARGFRATSAVTLRILLARHWRRWITQLAAIRPVTATAVALAAIARLRMARRHHRARAAMARWRRWHALDRSREWARQAPLCASRLRQAWRAWCRQRRVRSACRRRRSAHQARWALCRAFGRWRLHAVCASVRLRAGAGI